MGKLLTVLFILIGIAAVTAYMLSESDLQKTQRQTKTFYDTAAVGVSLADAVRASPDFKTVIFGSCGHIDSSPDSGPRGSLIFSPAQGEFARYTSFDEFISRNPKLLSEHPECRKVFVQYMPMFPVRGTVELEVDGRGLISRKSPPVIFQ